MMPSINQTRLEYYAQDMQDSSPQIQTNWSNRVRTGQSIRLTAAS